MADARDARSGVWYPRWYWPSFTLPSVLWLAVFFVLPAYVVLSVAFGTVDELFRTPLPVFQPWWWSFDTFTDTVRQFSGDGAYLDPLIRTLTYVVSASAICLVIGYAVAYYTARHAGRWRGLILVLLVTPFWISYLMRIYAWQSLLQPDGYINDAIGVFGVDPVAWVGRPVTVVLGLVYGYIPFMILPLYGYLDRISESLLEAGRDLGASPFQTFRRVTLPMSRPGILAGLVIVSLPMFGDYYTNDLLGSERTSMFGNLIDNSLTLNRGPEAGSLVLLLIALVMIPMLYYLRSTKRASEGR